MTTKFNRDSANEHLLLRLREIEVDASQWVPIRDRRRRTPPPTAPNIIQLVLREINADTGAFSVEHFDDYLQEDHAGYPSVIDGSRRH
jgi:hypothetical protein